MGQDLALSHTQDMLFINRKDTSKEEVWGKKLSVFCSKNITTSSTFSLWIY
jgi:hypothetical protein